MENWVPLTKKYENSVLQLICTHGSYNPFRPQFPPVDKKASGSGFIVDIDRGLVLTNAHVAANAIAISGRMTKFGEYDLTLEVVSICREKDVALCRLRRVDIDKIKSKIPDDINMKFGDNMSLSLTTPVLAIGYPLGQKNIKFTTGIVSGFYANSNENDEDSDFSTEEEGPSYIQITAPINPGNSGGPLVNMKGEVVGITAAGFMFSQNIGYAIGSRTILGIYDELTAPLRDSSLSMPYLVITPKYAFEYNQTTSDLLSLSCNSTEVEGIYIKTVYPNSCFDTLQEGDVITHIIYYDIYTDQDQAFNIINNMRRDMTGAPVVATLNKYGDITLKTECNGTCRNFTIKELFDIIPIGATIYLNICRNTKLNTACAVDTCSFYTITTSFKYIPVYIRNFVYPRLNPYKYVIIAGLSIGELTMNHISMDSSLEPYSRGKKRYKQFLIINQIFPDTTASHTRVFKENCIIKKVNGVAVKNIDELTHVLKQPDEYIIITAKDKGKFVVKKTTAIQEDNRVLEQFGIKNYQSILNSIK